MEATGLEEFMDYWDTAAEPKDARCFIKGILREVNNKAGLKRISIYKGHTAN